MTADSVELQYSLSVKDRQRMFRFLENRSLSHESAETRFFSTRYAGLAGMAACVFLLIMLFQWVMQLLTVIAAKGFVQMLSPKYLIGNAIGIILSFVLIRYVWDSISEYRRRNKVANSRGEGVNWGEQNLSATPDGLTIRLTKHWAVYEWAAFLDLIETKNLLLLLVTPRQAIPIPRDAFRTEAEEIAFREFVRSRIAKA